MRLQRRHEHAGFAFWGDVRVGPAGLMMSVHNGPLDWRGLNEIWWQMGRSQSRAASLCLKLGLHINAWDSMVSGCRVEPCLVGQTFLKKNSLEERVFVSQHQTLISGSAMSCLKVLQVAFMSTDRFFELLDILGSAFTKGCLSLPVSLLAFFRGGVNLNVSTSTHNNPQQACAWCCRAVESTYRLPATLSLYLLRPFL